MKPQIRYDAIRVGRMAKTPEGFLRGEAVVTRAGIFNYLDASGKIRRELRHPLDVFDSRSLESLRMVPVTLDHPMNEPGRLVTADNAKRLQRGTVGENVAVIDGLVQTSLCVTDAEAVKMVEAGKNMLSCGYTADVDETPGEYEGQRYDARQRNIRYNHLAIVDDARAGPEARLRLDSSEAVLQPDQEKRMDPKTVTVKLDGIDYVASPEVANALAKAQARADTAEAALNTAKATHTTALTAMTAERDGVKAKLDQTDADLKKLKEGEGERVKARVKLIADASRILGDELKADGTDVEIMSAAIVKAQPETKLDGKSPEYVRARFDAVLESLGDDKMAEQRRATGGAGGGTDKGGDKSKVKADSNTARQRMVERLTKPEAKSKDKE